MEFCQSEKVGTLVQWSERYECTLIQKIATVFLNSFTFQIRLVEIVSRWNLFSGQIEKALTPGVFSFHVQLYWTNINTLYSDH